MFNVGDLVTLSAIEIGKEVPINSIFVVVQAKQIHCSVKRYSTGKMERVSRLNKMLRKLTPTEIVLYGKG